MFKYFVLCIVFTLFGAFGGYFFKKSASESASVLNILFNRYLYIGGFLYFIGAILNILALRRLPYTIVMPMTSITYIWTTIISFVILKEKITSKKILGLLFILIGAIIMGNLK